MITIDNGQVIVDGVLYEPAGDKNSSLQIGQCYFVRSVTYHYTGRLVAMTATDLVLADAAWIADSGRFSDAMKTGVLAEIEPYPGNVILHRSAIVDCCEWPHALPREKK